MAFDIIFINKIGECIDRYQNKTGATKTWISKKMGFNAVQSLDMLTKSTNPTLINLIKLSVILGCSVVDLFEYQVEEE